MVEVTTRFLDSVAFSYSSLNFGFRTFQILGPWTGLGQNYGFGYDRRAPSGADHSCCAGTFARRCLQICADKVTADIIQALRLVLMLPFSLLQHRWLTEWCCSRLDLKVDQDKFKTFAQKVESLRPPPS